MVCNSGRPRPPGQRIFAGQGMEGSDCRMAPKGDWQPRWQGKDFHIFWEPLCPEEYTRHAEDIRLLGFPVSTGGGSGKTLTIGRAIHKWGEMRPAPMQESWLPGNLSVHHPLLISPSASASLPQLFAPLPPASAAPPSVSASPRPVSAWP